MPKRPSFFDPKVQVRYACHEAGHAVTGWYSPLRIRMRVVMPTMENMTGAVIPSPMPSDLLSRLKEWQTDQKWGFGTSFSQHAWEELAFVLGGLAGEGVGTGIVSTVGAGQDLRMALDIAVRTLKNHGPLSPWEEPPRSKVDIGAMFETRPTYQVNMLLNIAYRRAKQMISLHRRRYDRLVEELITRRELSHEELTRILGRKR